MVLSFIKIMLKFNFKVILLYFNLFLNHIIQTIILIILFFNHQVIKLLVIKVIVENLIVQSFIILNLIIIIIILIIQIWESFKYYDYLMIYNHKTLHYNYNDYNFKYNFLFLLFIYYFLIIQFILIYFLIFNNIKSINLTKKFKMKTHSSNYIILKLIGY